jgi:CTP:molybdopterin cytidylyltransferase MocA
MTLPPPFGADLKVLVLAGSGPVPRRRPAGTRESPLADKAFLPLRGRLIVEYGLEMLRDCGLRRVWLLAPEQELSRVPRGHDFTPVLQQPGAGFFANLSAASTALEPRPGEPVLVIFGDHPFLTPSALHAFLTGCSEQLEDADLLHALALQAQYREYAAWFGRTSVHMREMCGRASGLSLVTPSRLRRLHALGQVYDVRKLEQLESMVRLMLRLPRWLGRDCPRGLLDAVLVYLAKEMEKAGRGSSGLAMSARRLEAWLGARVPVRRLERYAARVLGAERGVRVVPVAHGGIAIDADFADELATLERHWDAIQEINARQDASLVHPGPR